MLRALLVTYFEYFLLTWYFFLTGNKVYGLETVRAMIYPIRNLKKIMVKRAMVQRLRKRSDKEIMKYMVPYSGVIAEFLSRLLKGSHKH